MNYQIIFAYCQRISPAGLMVSQFHMGCKALKSPTRRQGPRLQTDLRKSSHWDILEVSDGGL